MYHYPNHITIYYYYLLNVTYYYYIYFLLEPCTINAWFEFSEKLNATI